MEAWFKKVGDSVKAGAEDLARGVQGKETGRAQVLTFEFNAQALGMTVSDYGGEGMVSALVAGGEASAKGLLLNDRVVGVGGRRTGGYRDCISAIRGHPARPLLVDVERRVATAQGDLGSGLVNFRLDEECDKAERILAKMLAAASSRLGGGSWSGPSAIGTVGASVGFQFGAQVADFLIVLNDDRALQSFSGGGAFSLGGQIGAVAGPVGASREGAASMTLDNLAPIYTYSISKGLFAGISIEGTVINERNSVNERHYAFPGVRARQVLAGDVRQRPAARLLSALRALDGAAPNYHDDLINEPVAPPMKFDDATVASCNMLLRSIACRAPTPAALGAEFAKKIAAAGAPDALLWLTDASDAAFVARAAADAGAARRRGRPGGLVGGGREHYGPPEGPEPRVVALALGGAAATPFHSPPDGLPDLPADALAALAPAAPEDAPPLLLLAAPPRRTGFDIEGWLARMDAALPWSTKVGGIATESDLYLGGDALDGGVVGLALHGATLDAVVGQGATPVGPAFKVTACEGNVVRALDGSDVGAALDPVLGDWNPMMGDLKIGVRVPTRAAADGGPARADAPDAYVVRQLLGMNREASALAIGAAPDLLAAEDVAIQLHAFGPQAAKRELEDAAARLTGGAGGLIVPCAAAGPRSGEADVESRALAAALGRELELAGFFANGEIGPVGARTFVHTLDGRRPALGP
ncbi:hypothetical protein JL721_9231 [Aureococcus anophagefferens]|nr:hypothetical protein JL721_9231 [Aureococcus anophagefferens]